MSRYEPTKHEGIFLDRNSGTFYLRDTIHIASNKSEWVDKSLRTKSISEALIRANKIRQDLIRGETADRVLGKKHSFDEAFDQVIKIQSTMDPKTHTMAKSQIKHLRPWFRIQCTYLETFEKDPEGVWAEYCLAQKKITPGRKLKHDRRYLVMALIRARKLGWIQKEYSTTDFVLNEATTPIGQYIEDDDVKSILRALKTYPKDYLQFLIAITMGMRRGEILGLEVDEINLRAREIILDPNFIKTRRARRVPIPISDDVYVLLVLAVRKANEHAGRYIFPKWYTNEPGQPLCWLEHQEDNSYHWDLIRKKTGIHVRWHDTRHTAIANMLMAQIPISTVSKVVGATEETVTRIYDKVCGKMKDQIRSVFRGKYVETEGTGESVLEISILH